MIHNEEVTLLTYSASDSTLNATETTVFCGKKSVGFREFYAAIQVGINPIYVFEMDVDEYESACSVISNVKHIPTELMYGGAKYNIIRTYEKPDGTIEVTVSL